MEFIEIDENNCDDFEPSIKGGALILFFSNGCGHCTTMKPEWNGLKKKMNSLQHELDGVNIVSVNTDAAGKLDTKWHEHATSVPTIVAYKKDGKKVDYNKNRTTEDFIEFMREHLSSKGQQGGYRTTRRSKYMQKHKKRSNRRTYSPRKKTKPTKKKRKKSHKKSHKKSRKLVLPHHNSL